MKTLLVFVLGILVGLYLGTNYGIKLGKDLSVATIEKTFSATIYSGKDLGTGNLSNINELVKQKLDDAKQKMISDIKSQTREYLKQKIDDMFK